MPGIDEVLAQAMEIPGVLGAGLSDWTSGLSLGSAGRAPHGDHDAVAADTTEVAQAVAANTTFGEVTGGQPEIEDVIVTAAGGYHLLRFVHTAFDSRTYLHLWLDRERANLAVARLRLRELAAGLVAA